LEDEFSADDLEQAYRRALEVLDEADQSTQGEAVDAVHDVGAPEFADVPFNERHEQENSVTEAVAEVEASAPLSETVASDEIPASRSRTEGPDLPELAPGSPLTPRHVIEAALFVGGAPLTTKKLASLFKGSYENAYIEQQIDDLNRHYLAQNRPYQIQLVEGGHRLALRPEFDKIRQRVFGYGPKEVRLSQDALEVLALVAYQQPIHRDKVEECGKKNVSNLLNQLVRRELVAVTRGKNAKDLTYHTTPRFLSLFGIGSLDELPRPDNLAFK
ncbi:MAG: SMC-Scp complex subunit ScpB, partial [Planctomycetaceae bacterium]